MSKFIAFVHGSNCLSGKNIRWGFYLGALVAAASVTEAKQITSDMLHKRLQRRAGICNQPGDPPLIEFTDVIEVADWPAGCTQPFSHYGSYTEPPKLIHPA